MPVTLKAAHLKYKNGQGQYVGVNSVSDNTTAEQIAAIEAAGEDVIESIPSDYSELSGDVADLKSALKSIYPVSNNIFDDSVLDNTDKLTKTGDVYSGTATQFSQVYKKASPLAFNGATNQQYTISFDAYCTGSTTSSYGFSIYAIYSDNTDGYVVRASNSASTDTHFTGTTAANKTVTGLYFSYSSGGSNVWYVSNIQINIGTSESVYDKCAYNITTANIGEYGGGGFVTPENYGAKGDGVTDDSTAIQNAIDSGKPVRFSSTYVVGTTLNITQNKTILFTDGTGYIKLTGSAYINIQAYYVQIINLRIDSVTKCIVFGGNSSLCTLRNLLLVPTTYGIEIATHIWNNTFYDVKVNSGTVAIYCNTTNMSNGENTFVNCYFENQSAGIIVGESAKFIFIGCGFGLCSGGKSFIFRNGSDRTVFIGCNFEPTPSKLAYTPFDLQGGKYEFDCCMFYIRGTSSINEFLLTNVISIQINNCTLSPANDNEMPLNAIFNGSTLGITKPGGLEITNLTTSSEPIFADTDMICVKKDGIITFDTSKTPSVTPLEGMMVYDPVAKKICAYLNSEFVQL